MKVCLYTHMFPDIENDMKKSKNPNSVSGHKFQTNLVAGMEEQLQDNVKVINIPRIRAFPDYPQIVFLKKKWGKQPDENNTHIGYINLRPFNWITLAVNSYREITKWIRENKKEEKVIFTFNATLPQLICLLLIKKIHHKVVICECIGDLHGRYGISKELGLIGKMRNFYGVLCDLLSKIFDCYVLLTECMAKALKINNKPFVIVEGMYSEESSGINEVIGEERCVFYAGAIIRDYGIEHLLRAFSGIDGDYKLFLAGTGDAVEIVKKYAQKDKRITYLGLLLPEEIKKYQNKATVLINPRTSEKTFVKYSFPSKTMECLASGKPYIAHKLPCDPPEYSKYIQYAENESDESLKNKIVEICSLSENERQRIGKEARRFILQEKNPVMMTKHIITMWEKMLKIYYD